MGYVGDAAKRSHGVSHLPGGLPRFLYLINAGIVGQVLRTVRESEGNQNQHIPTGQV